MSGTKVGTRRLGVSYASAVKALQLTILLILFAEDQKIVEDLAGMETWKGSNATEDMAE